MKARATIQCRAKLSKGGLRRLDWVRSILNRLYNAALEERKTAWESEQGHLTLTNQKCSGRDGYFVLDPVSLRYGKIRLHPTPLGQRRDPPAGAPRRASPLGCHHGRASLSGVPAICGTRAALCCRIPEALAGPDRLAIGRLQVPSARPLDRLAPARTVPPVAADCQQHPPAGVGPTGRDPQSGDVCDGGQPAAPERRLAGGLRPSAGVGRGLRRSEAVRRHPVCGRELEVCGAHPRLFPQQRPLHRASRPPQADVRLSPPARGPKTAALSPAVPLLGAGAPGAGGSGRGPVAVVAARVRLHPGSPPTVRAASSSCRPCWRSGSWRACPGTGVSTPLGVMRAL